MALRQRDPEFERLPEPARLGIAERGTSSNRNGHRDARYRQAVHGGLDG